MDRASVKNQVVQILKNISNFNEVDEEQKIIDDLMISSIDLLHIVAVLEDTFKIYIKNTDIQRMTKVGDIVDMVHERGESLGPRTDE